MLPGIGTLVARPAAAALALVVSPTYAGSNFPMPTEAKVGDVAVYIDHRSNGASVPSSQIPSGWTTIANTTLGNSRSSISYKVLVAGDLGKTISGTVGNRGTDKVLLILRPDVTGTVTAAGLQTATSTGNPSAVVVTASGGTAPLAVIGVLAAYGGQTVTGNSFSPSGTLITASISMLVYWRIDLSAGQDTTIDQGDAGSANITQGFYISA